MNHGIDGARSIDEKQKQNVDGNQYYPHLVKEALYSELIIENFTPNNVAFSLIDDGLVGLKHSNFILKQIILILRKKNSWNYSFSIKEFETAYGIELNLTNEINILYTLSEIGFLDKIGTGNFKVSVKLLDRFKKCIR